MRDRERQSARERGEIGAKAEIKRAEVVEGGGGKKD